MTADGTERLAAAAVTSDGRFLLTGGAKGSVRLRWLHSLQVPFSLSFVPECLCTTQPTYHTLPGFIEHKTEMTAGWSIVAPAVSW